jgi:predicted flap endonuclease-1-like 5' DNA nuclease
VPPPARELGSFVARRPSEPPPVALALDVRRIAQLERELEETQSRATKLLAELSSLRPALLELDAARARLLELEARVLELSVSRPPDDLRRIKGIGPKFEQALHAAGIRSYAQIAAWSAADIVAIAQKVGARADRLEREEWVAKARTLLGSA